MSAILAGAVIGMVTLKAVHLENPDLLVPEETEDAPVHGHPLTGECRVLANEDDESFDYYVGDRLTRKVFLDGGYEKYDETGRLHCTNGPAIKYADGTVEYFQNGIPVFKSYFTDSVSRSATR